MFTGDNLEVMRGFNDSCVDLIYLDPPFNSNHNYAAPIGSDAAGAAFKDTWGLDDIDIAWHGIIADQNPSLYSVINSTVKKSDRAYLTYMAIRILEMKRILKETGSIYLHCDPTMSHYLKLTMDVVFGRDNFRNEIIWKRKQEKHNLASSRLGSTHDTILFYALPGHRYNRLFKPYDDEYIEKNYRHRDSRGLYATFPCTNESGGNASYEFQGQVRAWRFAPETMQHMYEADMLTQARPDSPFRYKKYLNDGKGVPMDDLWLDIEAVRSKPEKTGYPTQKPLALLRRIINASTNAGEIVLDPFCGCATAAVAAQEMGRRWIGIDVSQVAFDLVKSRLENELQMFNLGIIHRTDIPRRTDIEDLPNYRTHKHSLYGNQEGRCAGCNEMFHFKNLTIVHIVPRSKGGHDGLENLQLLCGFCNSTKGDRSQEFLLAKLKELNDLN